MQQSVMFKCVLHKISVACCTDFDEAMWIFMETDLWTLFKQIKSRSLFRFNLWIQLNKEIISKGENTTQIQMWLHAEVL